MRSLWRIALLGSEVLPRPANHGTHTGRILHGPGYCSCLAGFSAESLEELGDVGGGAACPRGHAHRRPRRPGWRGDESSTYKSRAETYVSLPTGRGGRSRRGNRLLRLHRSASIGSRRISDGAEGTFCFAPPFLPISEKSSRPCGTQRPQAARFETRTTTHAGRGKPRASADGSRSRRASHADSPGIPSVASLPMSHRLGPAMMRWRTAFPAASCRSSLSRV